VANALDLFSLGKPTTIKICDPALSDARKNGRLSHFRPEHLKGRLAGNPATG
jgi:hypothetical protein